VRFDDIVSNEIEVSTDDSWDFFSEDTVNSNIALVRLTNNLIGDTTIIILVLNETKVLP